MVNLQKKEKIFINESVLLFYKTNKFSRDNFNSSFSKTEISVIWKFSKNLFS